jgi:hypothetical protein
MLDQYIYLSRLDVQLKMPDMKRALTEDDLARQYEALRQRLAQIGYITQGSVLDRSRLTPPPRSGYQWTRKVGRKTVTVSLSRAQYEALNEAVKNERTLWKIVGEMERLSRRILFQTLPDTRRRKRLTKKVLGLN